MDNWEVREERGKERTNTQAREHKGKERYHDKRDSSLKLAWELPRVRNPIPTI